MSVSRILHLVDRAAEEILFVWFRQLFRARGVSVGQGVRFAGRPLITLTKDSTIIIGDRVSAVSRSEKTALGLSHPLVIRTLRPGAVVKIGEDTGLSGTSICASISVSIGARCLIGADVKVFDTDFHPIAPNNRRFNNDPECIKSSAVHIGDDVFIGASSIVCKGVTIGRGTVIAAGSVVTRSVPDNCVAGGNPARIIRRMAVS